MARHMARGLVIFDLDGTLLRGLTSCEVLAVPLGKQTEMRAIEQLTHEHELAAARFEMAAWYRAMARETLLSHLDNAVIAPGAAEGIAALQDEGFEVGIASLTWAAAVERFAARFGISRFIGTGLHDDGSITHVWPRDKASWLRTTAEQLGLSLDRVAAIGDSHGDRPMLEIAGLKIFVGAHPIDVAGCHHAPAADIREIAKLIRETLD